MLRTVGLGSSGLASRIMSNHEDKEQERQQVSDEDLAREAMTCSALCSLGTSALNDANAVASAAMAGVSPKNEDGAEFKAECKPRRSCPKQLQKLQLPLFLSSKF